MSRRNLFAILVSLSVAAACGSPTSPASDASFVATQAAVLSTMTQAMSRLALVGTSGATPNTFTMPCPAGGSIVMTVDPLPAQQASVYHSSSRMEFRDCKNQAATL